MKRFLKRYRSASCVFIALMILHACSEKKEGNTVEDNQKIKIFNDSLYRVYTDSIENSNIKRIRILFDSIAYESLNLVLRDRAFGSFPDEAPDLKGLSLEQMEGALQPKNKDIDSVKSYRDKFVLLRDAFLDMDLSKRRVYIRVGDSIPKSKVYINHILKNHANDSLYVDLTYRVEQHIKKSEAQFLEIMDQDSWAENNKALLKRKYENYHSRITNQQTRFAAHLEKYSVLILTLLIISFLCNIFFGAVLYRNKKKIKENDEERANDMDIVPENEWEEKEKQKGETENYTAADIPSQKPTILVVKEVKEHISEHFERKRAQLQNEYHKDCIQSEIGFLNDLEMEFLNKAKSEEFHSASELQQYIEQKIDPVYERIKEKLEELLDRSKAQKKLETEPLIEELIGGYRSALISVDEIRNKVNHIRRKQIEELPPVLSKEDYKKTLDELLTSAQGAIEKMITDNSVLYFPYADKQGMLPDNKKTKEKDRNSAIRLTLDLKDTTKATFQLLYDCTEMMTAGIQSYNVLLTPICELKGEDFNRNGTKIVQNGADGVMVLRNEKWQVERRLPIKIL